MRIIVFGANGKVGRLLVAELLSRGHEVRAFVHGISHFEPNPHLEVVSGDIYDKRSVAKAVEGTDAVMSTLGSWGTPKKDILTVGMQHIIPAMKASKITKIVSLTGHGCNAKGDDLSLLHNIGRALFSILAGKILRDGENHLALLEASDLDWSVLRSPVMNKSGDPHTYTLTRTKRPADWETINRRSVVLGLVDLLESSSFSKQSPFIRRH